MRQKKSFFLISIKPPLASLRGGGGSCSLFGSMQICFRENRNRNRKNRNRNRKNFFHLIGTRAR